MGRPRWAVDLRCGVRLLLGGVADRLFKLGSLQIVSEWTLGRKIFGLARDDLDIVWAFEDVKDLSGGACNTPHSHIGCKEFSMVY